MNDHLRFLVLLKIRSDLRQKLNYLIKCRGEVDTNVSDDSEKVFRELKSAIAELGKKITSLQSEILMEEGIYL